MTNMQDLGARTGLSVCTGWCVFMVAGLFLSPAASLVLGVMGAGCVGLSHVVQGPARLPADGLIALLAPFGVMLPALALRQVLVANGLGIPGFSSAEILVFLLAYAVFLMASFGVLPIDLYRFGYAVWPVACIALALCLYALVTGNWFLAVVTVAAQGVWVAGWASENWFDTMLHVALVPVALITLLIRLF